MWEASSWPTRPSMRRARVSSPLRTRASESSTFNSDIGMGAMIILNSAHRLHEHQDLGHDRVLLLLGQLAQHEIQRPDQLQQLVHPLAGGPQAGGFGVLHKLSVFPESMVHPGAAPCQERACDSLDEPELASDLAELFEGEVEVLSRVPGADDGAQAVLAAAHDREADRQREDPLLEEARGEGLRLLGVAHHDRRDRRLAGAAVSSELLEPFLQI